MKIILEFKNKDLIRFDFIEKSINALLDEKNDIDKNDITLYWEKSNIYAKKMKAKDSYRIHFGFPK